MPGLSRSVVRTLLAIQDFHPPEEELTEVTLRLNTLVEGLTTLEDLDVFQVEPWTALPAPSLKTRAGGGNPVPEAESAHTDEIAFMTIAEQAPSDPDEAAFAGGARPALPRPHRPLRLLHPLLQLRHARRGAGGSEGGRAGNCRRRVPRSAPRHPGGNEGPVGHQGRAKHRRLRCLRR